MIEVEDYLLIIDGVEYGDSVHVLFDREADNEVDSPLRVAIFNDAATEKILTHRFIDLPRKVVKVDLHPHYQLSADNSVFLSMRIEREGVNGFTLSFSFGFDSLNWKKLWSFSEYVSKVSSIAEQQGLLVTRSGSSPHSLSIVFTDTDANSTINDEALKKVKVLQPLYELTEAELIKTLHESSVVMRFDFPEEVRIPCEQYLLYFVQFLKDLGVEATAELQHQAGQLLFAVTPTNKDEALDKIREALGTYLQLPSNPGGDSMNVEQEVAVQRLAANIDHLKSQLRLAHAELRLAGATMQTQQVTINHLLSGEVIVESIKDVTTKTDRDSKEELLGGTVALTKYNLKGVELNLAEIFRKMRQLFTKGD